MFNILNSFQYFDTIDRVRRRVSGLAYENILLQLSLELCTWRHLGDGLSL